MVNATLAGITLHPFKALDGHAVARAAISAGGALVGDRRWAFVDGEGRPVNAKRHAQIHRIRTRYADDLSWAEFTADGLTARFPLDGPGAELCAWMGARLGFPVGLREDAAHGLPDDREAGGPTLVAQASLAAVAGWFPGLAPGSLAARFRTNLELAGVPAFWEDRLFTTKPGRVALRIGGVLLHGTGPCARCVVPTRDPHDGTQADGFAQTFRHERLRALPEWAERTRFDHTYRLAVNTVIPPGEAGKWLAVGDAVEVLGTVDPAIP